jgi:hypothetical protein
VCLDEWTWQWRLQQSMLGVILLGKGVKVRGGQKQSCGRSKDRTRNGGSYRRFEQEVDKMERDMVAFWGLG